MVNAAYFEPCNDKFVFGSKAETLERLGPLLEKAQVLELDYFLANEWRAEPDQVLDRIAERFGPISLAIRSSAFDEDRADLSMAGAYRSVLSVDGSSYKSVSEAIETVIASYSGNSNEQVLVQPMLARVALSGVIMTHDIQCGSLFYAIEYDDESGRTDSITGGTNVQKSVLVFRGIECELIQSKRVAMMVAVARELEDVCGNVPLDIEFAVTSEGRFYVLQVRRISLRRTWSTGTLSRVAKRLAHIEEFIDNRSQRRIGLAGGTTILGIMPDWNPAEIIGTTPKPLAASLYRELITRDVWTRGRERMGYRHMPAEELMVMIGGHPYVDVRNSFNSFLPQGLDDTTSNALVDAWLQRLADHPELHDKVEFDVAQTCLDFEFRERFKERYPDTLSQGRFAVFEGRSRELTNQALRLGSEGTLALAVQIVDQLSDKQANRRFSLGASQGAEPLSEAADLLQECRTMGTVPFTIIARHAFIAESLLRSALRRGALTEERLAIFRRSLHTITGELARDFASVAKGVLNPKVFTMRYGHLRPGSYDIVSPRYDERNDLFTGNQAVDTVEFHAFELLPNERRALNVLLKDSGITSCDADGLVKYARRAMIGREDAKFVFSRNLSDALEAITRWGEQLGLSREDLSFLRVSDLLETLSNVTLDDMGSVFSDLSELGRKSAITAETLKLNYLIRDSSDLFVLPLHRSAPNFIGVERVEATPIHLDCLSPGTVNLFGKIICIDNADPGYDWIFTKGIKGLITKYGGANSHMAIRCAEFGLPAAIGCGELSFEKLIRSRRIELNAADKLLRQLDVVAV